MNIFKSFFGKKIEYNNLVFNTTMNYAKAIKVIEATLIKEIHYYDNHKYLNSYTIVKLDDLLDIIKIVQEKGIYDTPFVVDLVNLSNEILEHILDISEESKDTYIKDEEIEEDGYSLIGDDIEKLIELMSIFGFARTINNIIKKIKAKAFELNLITPQFYEHKESIYQVVDDLNFITTNYKVKHEIYSNHSNVILIKCENAKIIIKALEEEKLNNFAEHPAWQAIYTTYIDKLKN